MEMEVSNVDRLPYISREFDEVSDAIDNELLLRQEKQKNSLVEERVTVESHEKTPSSNNSQTTGSCEVRDSNANGAGPIRPSASGMHQLSKAAARMAH